MAKKAKEAVSEVAEEKEVTAPAKKKKIIPKDIDVNQYITVYNGFQGQLVYISKRTGETFEWDGYGDSQDVELRELKNAKNSYKKFFTHNWFMFSEEDDWVIDYLGVRAFYRNAIPLDGFDELFELPTNELVSKISKLSTGQKRSVIYRAKQLIAEHQIDSLNKISALEEALDVELIER